MRAIVDLPEDLYAQASAIARDTHWTFSEAVAYLMRCGLGHGPGAVAISARTGLPVVHLGRTITAQNVWAVDDGC